MCVHLFSLELLLGGHSVSATKLLMVMLEVLANRSNNIFISCSEHTVSHYLAPADYIAINGSFDITDSNREQCVNISVVSGKTIEDEECFNYTIVTSSNTIGLTLSPNTATICTSEPQEGKYNKLVIDCCTASSDTTFRYHLQLVHTYAM